MHGKVTIPIPVELRAINPSKGIASTDAIFDYRLNKNQEDVNLATEALNSRVNTLENLINSIGHLFTYEFTDVRPEASASTMYTIYFVSSEESGEEDVYELWITVRTVEESIEPGGEDIINFSWKRLGNANVDLSAYSTTEEMQGAILAAVSEALSNILNSSTSDEKTEFNLLKEWVDSYQKNVHYLLEDYDTTKINLYATSSVRSLRADLPLPINLKLPNDTNVSSILVADNPEFTNFTTYPILDSLTHEKTVVLRNLIPGKKYFYKVGTSGAIKAFYIELTRRFIYANNVRNVRDLGGIPTEDGGYVAFDKIFRGGELNVSVTASNTALDSFESLGITYDLDLRNAEEIAGGYGVTPLRNAEYKRIPLMEFRDIRNLTDNDKLLIKEAFETVANNAINGIKTYIHCRWGYHRAGFLCALIEGCLGVKQCEIDKDHELSAFSQYGIIRRTEDTYKDGILALNELYNGSWTNLLISCGVSYDLIKNFRNVMIIDLNTILNKPYYYNITYSQLVALKNNSALIPGSYYRMIDFDTEDGTEDEIIGCSGIPDLPRFKAAHHHFDLLLTAISNNELDCDVKALHSARDTEGYFNDVDLSKWELKYDINNDRSKYSWAVNTDVELEEPIRRTLYSGNNPIIAFNSIIDTNDVYIDCAACCVKLDGNSLMQSNTSGTVVRSSMDSIQLDSIVNLAFDNSRITIYHNQGVTINSADVYGVTVYQETTDSWTYHHEGKGVIYYMKDDRNNECSYDFKNIMFYLDEDYVYTFNISEYKSAVPAEVSGGSPIKAAGEDPIYIQSEINSEVSSLYTSKSSSNLKFTLQLLVNFLDAGEAIFVLLHLNFDEVKVDIETSGPVTIQYTKPYLETLETLEVENIASIVIGRTIIGAHSSTFRVFNTTEGTNPTVSFTIHGGTVSTENQHTENNIIKSYHNNGRLDLNNNVFVTPLEIPYYDVRNNFLDYNCTNNVFWSLTLNCNIGKFCIGNTFFGIESCNMEESCSLVELTNMDGRRIYHIDLGKQCYLLHLNVDNEILHLIVDDFVHEFNGNISSPYTRIFNDIVYIPITTI